MARMRATRSAWRNVGIDAKIKLNPVDVLYDAAGLGGIMHGGKQAAPGLLSDRRAAGSRQPRGLLVVAAPARTDQRRLQKVCAESNRGVVEHVAVEHLALRRARNPNAEPSRLSR